MVHIAAQCDGKLFLFMMKNTKNYKYAIVVLFLTHMSNIDIPGP